MENRDSSATTPLPEVPTYAGDNEMSLHLRKQVNKGRNFRLATFCNEFAGTPVKEPLACLLSADCKASQLISVASKDFCC
jgi:hypothetical protein